MGFKAIILLLYLVTSFVGFYLSGLIIDKYKKNEIWNFNKVWNLIKVVIISFISLYCFYKAGEAVVTLRDMYKYGSE